MIHYYLHRRIVCERWLSPFSYPSLFIGKRPPIQATNCNESSRPWSTVLNFRKFRQWFFENSVTVSHFHFNVLRFTNSTFNTGAHVLFVTFVENGRHVSEPRKKPNRKSTKYVIKLLARATLSTVNRYIVLDVGCMVQRAMGRGCEERGLCPIARAITS